MAVLWIYMCAHPEIGWKFMDYELKRERYYPDTVHFIMKGAASDAEITKACERVYYGLPINS